MSDFIPNSFQVPNAYIDLVWHLLTPQEQSVLIYMARRIFGFNKRQDRISISQFTSGTRSRKDGRQLDGGTGLGADAVRRALAGLIEFGLAEELDGATRSEGPMFGLQLDGSCLDLAGLEARRDARIESAKHRTQRARETKEGSVQQTTVVCWTEGEGSVGQRHNKQWEIQGEKQVLPLKEDFSISNSSAYRDEPEFDFPHSLFGGDGQ